MKTLIIVEGKSDTNRLKALYKDVQTFETSGLGLDQKKIQYLKSIEDETKIIIFTDPDGPGEIIRNRLVEELKQPYHAYLPNDKALSKNMKKVGIEHASFEDIKIALNNLYIENEIYEEFYSLEDLIDLGIYNNKKLRKEFCDHLHIAYGNNKKVLKQLNSFRIKPQQIKKFLEDKYGTS